MNIPMINTASELPTLFDLIEEQEIITRDLHTLPNALDVAMRDEDENFAFELHEHLFQKLKILEQNNQQFDKFRFAKIVAPVKPGEDKYEKFSIQPNTLKQQSTTLREQPNTL